MENDNMFLNSGFFNPNWETNPVDQNDPFESALSSMVSSPTASNSNNGENVVLRELIGKLGSICNSGELNNSYNHGNNINGNNSTNTSCYSTPLNSPPKLNLSAMENQQIRGNFQGTQFPSLSPFAADPGFVDRAARFSCFAQMGLNDLGPRLYSENLSRVSSNHTIKIPGSDPGIQEYNDGFLQDPVVSASDKPENAEFGDSRENSTVSEQIADGEIGLNGQVDANSRKRKSNPRGKEKVTPASTSTKDNVSSHNIDSNAKKSKSDDCSANENGTPKKADMNQKQSKDSSKPPEPPKDYIHVRARRGQATDAHSLAERVRREKISERMKFLQDLVPGCNKVTGKAVMLDEIINYVQSLQRQVEFLSMKLATVNPTMDFHMESHVSKDMFQSRSSLPNNLYTPDGYPFQSQPGPNLHNGIPCGTEAPSSINHFGIALLRNQSMQLSSADDFSEAASQVSTLWADDLHSVVQMGLGENQLQKFHGIQTLAQMKIEL